MCPEEQQMKCIVGQSSIEGERDILIEILHLTKERRNEFIKFISCWSKFSHVQVDKNKKEIFLKYN